MDERFLEIVIARRRRVLDCPAPHIKNPPGRIFRVGLHVKYFGGIQPAFQGGQRDNGFKNGARRIVFVGGSVFFR